MKLLGLDHVGVVVRDIDEAVARAGDTVDGRAVGERLAFTIHAIRTATLAVEDIERLLAA